MPSGKSDFLKNKQQNNLFNGVEYVEPTSVYIALFTAMPTAAGGGTEVTGGAYARAAIPCNAANFPATTTGEILNALAITFAQATAAWGTVVGWAAFDALTSGNMLWFGPVAPTKTVASGDTLSIAVNQLKFKELNSAA